MDRCHSLLDINCEEDFQRILKKRFYTSDYSLSDAANEIEANSFIFRSFRNEFETDHLFTDHSIELIKSGALDLDASETEEASNKRPYIPGYKPHCFLPSYSELTRKQMSDCFQMYLTMCNNKQLMGPQLTLYNQFMDVIRKEQELFQDIAKGTWYKTNFLRHNEIKPVVLDYTTNLWKKRLQRLNWYPKHYMKLSDMRLIDDSMKVSVLVYSKKLHSLGKLSTYHKITQQEKRCIYKDAIEFCRDESSTIESTTNTCYKKIHPKLIGRGYHPDVSKDKIAENLASGNNAQVVMSASSFLRLLNNHKDVGQNSWYLPIVIKEQQKDESTGPPKKVVYLDKVLPPKSLSAFQRNKWFCKKIISSLLKTPPKHKKQNHEEPRSYCYQDLDNPDNFHNVGSPKKNFFNLSLFDNGDKTDSNDPAAIKEDISDSCIRGMDSEEELMIDLSDNEDLQIKKEDELKKDDESNIENNISEYSPHVSPKEHKQTFRNESPTKKNTDYKVEYNLWSLKCESSNVLLKSNLKDLQVIIRVKIDGKITDSNGTSQVHSTKLEFQPEFGAEMCTLNEICRDWGNALIRPNSDILRVRVDPIDGEIIMFEKKNLRELTAEYQHHFKTNPYDKIASIHVILSQLIDLPVGNYLLGYSPENGLFSNLYKEENRKHNFNLNLDYIHVDCKNVATAKASWLMIDTAVITPTCKFFRRIPATFYPKFNKLHSKLEGSKCQGLVQKTLEFNEKINENKRLKRRLKSKKYNARRKKAKVSNSVQESLNENYDSEN